MGLYVVRGAVLVNGDCPAHTQQLVVLGWNSADVQLNASEDSLVLVLAGAPIEEPLATYGPFVMDNNEELMAAIADFEGVGWARSRRMSRLVHLPELIRTSC